METKKIRHFIPKIRNRIAVEKNRLWKYVDVDKVSSGGYVSFNEATALKRRLSEMLGIFTPELFKDVSSKDKEMILACAERALHHCFDLLGSGQVHIEPIDWHIDFKSGKRWEKRFYRDIAGIKGADIKVPWELSRCQHLLWIGEAYLLTGDEKYAKEVVDEINWWIDDNPLMYSVNWKCSMDVAFRAANWMYVLNMISGYIGFDDKFTAKVSKSLWQHGFFIRNNLEKQIPYSNNHYASDIVGLLYIGAFFNQSYRGRRWYHFALKEFYSEVGKQVLKSGVHYERSISYHRLMTELISYPAYMLQRLGEKIPDDIRDRIYAMYKYVSSYTKPNGFAPLIADNDDGRFVPFVNRDFRQHNYLNDTLSVENRIAATGCKSYTSNSFSKTHFYPDAGVAVLRNEDDYLYVNHGGYSKYPQDSDMIIGTHTHNDLLSFELCMSGRDVLVDAGTYLYTSSEVDRNEFRSTAKHNTIVVDGEEQNDFYSSFELRRNVHKRSLIQIADNVFEGEYTTMVGQMHHKRVFDFKGEELIITDSINKAGKGHEAKMFFHFPQGVSAEVIGQGIITDSKVLICFDVNPVKIEVVDDTISPSFGVVENTKTGVVTYKYEEQLTIKTTIKFLG